MKKGLLIIAVTAALLSAGADARADGMVTWATSEMFTTTDGPPPMPATPAIAPIIGPTYYSNCDWDACFCDLLQRPSLTGGLFGLAPKLAEGGILYEATATQFYQGVASGGGQQRFRYGDKMDVFVNADTGKLGLWEGGLLTMHAVDWQFGRNSIGDAVGLAPVNTALLTPKIGEPAYAMTSLQYTQQLSNGWAATIGRVNLLDLWVGFYPEYGRGIDGFMNLSTMLPLNTIPSLPLITNAAGILKAGERGVEAGFVVLESQHSPTTVGLDFPNGVTLLAVGRKYTDFGGRPGSHTLVGVYATGKYTSFDDEGWPIIPGGGVQPAAQSGTWHATYYGQQQLWSDPSNPQRHSDRLQVAPGTVWESLTSTIRSTLTFRISSAS